MKTITDIPSKVLKLKNEIEIVKFKTSDVEALMDRHDLNVDTRSIVEKENLIPTTLLSRLHNSFPQHSQLKAKSKVIFANAKNNYTGLQGFKIICGILEENGIILSDINFYSALTCS